MPAVEIGKCIAATGFFEQVVMKEALLQLRREFFIAAQPQRFYPIIKGAANNLVSADGIEFAPLLRLLDFRHGHIGQVAAGCTTAVAFAQVDRIVVAFALDH